MNLGQMISRVRRMNPGATVESISDQVITDELNHGCDEINLLTQTYFSYTEFNSVANQQMYSLPIYVPTYLGIRKEGVWWYTSAGKSWYLFPKTLKWLDLHIRNWRDAAAGNNPTWYWIEGDELGFYPKPSGVNKIRMYHLKEATKMDNSNNYPWTNTVLELGSMRPYDNALVAYARWAISPASATPSKEDPLYQRFLAEVNKARTQANRRPDFTSDFDYFERIDAPYR
jgi:hypothetical protein